MNVQRDVDPKLYFEKRCQLNYNFSIIYLSKWFWENVLDTGRLEKNTIFVISDHFVF